MAAYTLWLANETGRKELLRWYSKRPSRIASKWHKYVDQMIHKTGHLAYRLELHRQ